MAEPMLSIGEFAARSRLSAKALRLYDELGLLPPARVDAQTGYRWYNAGQLDQARMVALLRGLQMPLAQIAAVLTQPAGDAITLVRAYWDGVEHDVAARRPTLDYLCSILAGATVTDSHSVVIRTLSERVLLSATRHVHAAEAGALLGETLARMRQAGRGRDGIEGCPFTIYYGAVTDDSDGPVEVVRPIADRAQAERAAADLGDVSIRTEAAHEEAFVRLTRAESDWPAQLPVLEAIQAHLHQIGRQAAGPPRIVMIADWRTVGPDEPACDLAIPLAPAE